MHIMSSFVTYSRLLLNVCFLTGNLSRWFVMMCWSAASLHLHLLNVSHCLYDSMQTHAITCSFFRFVTYISRSRKNNCPSYVPLGRKMILSIFMEYFCLDISDPVMWLYTGRRFFWCNSCHFNISMWMSVITTIPVKKSNDCFGDLLHLGLNVITFRNSLHLGPNVITFRTLLHLGQL